MTKIKLTIIAMFFAITSSAYAKPVLDVINGAGTTGNTFAESNLISDALKDLGYDSKVVVTRNCVNTKAYMAKNTGRPGIFLRDTGRYVKDEERGCHNEINDKTFVGAFYKRHQAMCVRADVKFTTIGDFLKGRDRVTIANSSTLINGLYDDLSEQTGVKFIRVDYNGSSKTLKGLIAGDTDLLYTGFTKREISTNQVNCFTTSSTESVDGRPPMSELFPDWHLNTNGTLKYFHSVNIPDAQLATVKNDLNKIIDSNKTVASYLKKAFMTPGTAMDDQNKPLLSQKAFWDIVSVLTRKQVASK